MLPELSNSARLPDIAGGLPKLVMVREDKSPYDGDWVSWASRLGRHPTGPTRVVLLLKKQRGRCAHYERRFLSDEIMKVHHLDGYWRNQVLSNLLLMVEVSLA